MINFRYHVVSLTAVFLALAVGLVLGSTVLNGPMLDALETRVNNMGRENSQLRDQVSILEEEANREQDWATEAAPKLLANTLSGRRVGLVVTPSGTDYVEGVVEKLELTGARLTGTLTFTDKFTHPQHRMTELLDLADTSRPPRVPPDTLGGNSDGVEDSAALLAAVLFVDPEIPNPGEPGGDQSADDAGGDEPDGTDLDSTGAPGVEQVTGATDADRRRVLAAYANSEFVERQGWNQAAEIVIVVAGLPESENDADERNDALVMAVTQFGLTGPVVLAGSGTAGEDNIVSAVRDNPELSEEISTVDNAATPQGQVAAGMVVAERLAGGVGHYGAGAGADSLLPDTAASQ
jgi:hypothetical protein